MIYEIIFIAGCHMLDMVFTVKTLKKRQKDYHNVYEMEVNFHKYFFKKFGLRKGALISINISLPILIGLTIISYKYFGNKNFTYFIMGMVAMVAYINYISYISYDDMKKLRKKTI